MSSKPHIVFILSDQHNPSVIGAFGDPFVRTPHMDRLAREGVSLSNCYCASPLCVPSRMAMLTGKLPTRTGVFTNHQTLSSQQPTFAHGLSAAGYETVLCGRMHFLGMDQWHGFEKRLVGDYTATLPDAVELDYGGLREATGQSDRGLASAGPGRSNVMSYDEDVTRGALDFLRHRKEPRPLFLTVGYYGPHCPFICPRDLFAYYWERLPVLEAPRHYYPHHHPALRDWMDRRGLGKVTKEQVRIVRAAYYGLVEIMDRHLGRILEEIDRSLGRENTLIVYGSDHGEMMGGKGLFWKSTFFDDSVRVPLLFHQPGVTDGGRNLGQTASLLDLGPTLLDHCGAPPLPGAEGRSLMPVLTGRKTEMSDRAVISMLVDHQDQPGAMIRHGDWKLVSHHGYPEPQLFNMRADPGEENDLGGDPDWQDTRRDLLEQLATQWDPVAALDAVKENPGEARLIRAANAASRKEPPAQWFPDASMNEIEPWP